MQSKPPPPKARSNPPPSAADVKRADEVLDRMFVNLTLPRPPESTEPEEGSEPSAADEEQPERRSDT
ncbi:MAG TPA: hypothetical protein VFZ53_28665 [Polyangiaceae bacterium]